MSNTKRKPPTLEEFERELAIDALIGLGVPHHKALTIEKNGFAEFCGNQYNDQYRWKRDVLETIPVNDLRILYTSLKWEDVEEV